VSEEKHHRATALRELAVLFLKLGTIGFGGPAAHIAMMEEEVVTRRRWLTREHFLDLLGATNLIPGPNSTEMAIHVGYLRGGWLGLVIAGACFIVPAVLITAAFAWAYVTFGALPAAGRLLFGIKPAVLAVILGAVWRLGKTALKGWPPAVIGGGVLAASLLGVNELLVLLAGGVLGAAFLYWMRRAPAPPSDSPPPPNSKLSALLPWSPLAAAPLAGMTAGASVAAISLWKLGLFFLKVGAVLYGGGYVLISFLEGGLVRDYGWLTQRQLLDAIAIGQFTPGPVLSTATFIGYVLAGWPGAAVATLGIFLPSFLYVAGLGPVLPRMRRSRWAAPFLDAVNASSVALMAAVAIKLIPATLTSWPALAIAAVAAVISIFGRVNAAWLVLGGAAVGALLMPL